MVTQGNRLSTLLTSFYLYFPKGFLSLKEKKKQTNTVFFRCFKFESLHNFDNTSFEMSPHI